MWRDIALRNWNGMAQIGIVDFFTARFDILIHRVFADVHRKDSDRS